MSKQRDRLLLGGLVATLGLLGSNPQMVKADHLATSNLVNKNKAVRLKPKSTLKTKKLKVSEPTDDNNNLENTQAETTSPTDHSKTQPDLADNGKNQSNVSDSSGNSSDQAVANSKTDSAKDISKDAEDKRQLNKAEKPTLAWGSLALNFDQDTDTLTIPAGEVTDPTPITELYYDGINQLRTRPKHIIIQGPLKIMGSAENLFGGLTGLTDITGIENLDTSEVKNMRRMFGDCRDLTALDVSGFKTDNVTDMSEMFKDCHSLTTLDVSHFNTINVTDMNTMFDLCYNLTNLDVSGFKTAKVKDMHQMFFDCRSLPNLDVSHFDTSSVENMMYMFGLCMKVPEINVSGFNTSKVTDMQGMFTSCTGVTSLAVNDFDTSNVTSMMGMFAHCSKLQTLDVSNFNTQNVTDMSQMFEYCPKLQKLNVSNFNTEKVENLSYMFTACSSLEALDISSFAMNISDSAKVNHMLSDLTSLNLLKLGKNDRMPNTGLNTPGIWVKVGSGTIDLPEADKDHRWTSEQLMDKYSPDKDYDTYVRYAALVIAHYQDESGNSLAPNVFIKGGLTDSYTTEAKNIPGYTLTKAPDNANGNFADNTVTDVYYIYKKSTPNKPVTPTEPSKAANVIVHYQDENGNSLAPDVILSGKVGDGYVTSSKEFSGYTLKARPANATGFFTTTRQEVTYIYTKNGSTPEDHTPTPTDTSSTTPIGTPTTHKTHKGNHRTPIKQIVNAPVPGKTINNIPKDPDQSQTLPQTGSNKHASLVIAALGWTISALAISAAWITKKHKKD